MVDSVFLEVAKEAGKYLLLAGAAAGVMLLTKDKDTEFRKLMKNCGLINKDEQIPLIVDKQTKPYGTVYVLHLPYGLSIDKFETQKSALENGFGGAVELQKGNNCLVLTVFNKELGTDYPFEHITEIQGKAIKPMQFVCGVTRKGYLVIDLHGDEPHLGIGGTTKSGKSVFMRVLITCAILKPPEDLIIDLIDMKRGTEFGIFFKSSRVDNYARDEEGTLRVLNALKDEMEYRLDLFAKYGDIENIEEYNKRFRQNKLPYRLLVIDEFTLLKKIKGAHDLAELLLMQARAVGIHVVPAMQTQHAENLPGTLKTNLGGTIAFKTKNKRHSEILLEVGDAANLRGKGHGLYQVGSELIEFQGFNIDSTRVKQLIRHTYINKKPKEEEPIGVVAIKAEPEDDEPIGVIKL